MLPCTSKHGRAPSKEKLRTLEDDDEFTTTPIAKTVADSNGRYELRVDPTIALDRFMSKRGLIEGVPHRMDIGRRWRYDFELRVDRNSPGRNYSASNAKIHTLLDSSTSPDQLDIALNLDRQGGTR